MKKVFDVSKWRLSSPRNIQNWAFLINLSSYCVLLSFCFILVIVASKRLILIISFYVIEKCTYFGITRARRSTGDLSNRFLPPQMVLWRLSRSESSCKFLQNRGHFLSFGVCSSEWTEERFAYYLAWIHEKKRFFCRLTSCTVKRLLWKFFLTVFEYNVTWYGTLGISVKPYSFVFYTGLLICVFVGNLRNTEILELFLWGREFSQKLRWRTELVVMVLREMCWKEKKKRKEEQRWSGKVIFWPINS